MIAVRPEMAGAIRKYAEPITGYPVIAHQVQYLGTDRRLTYSMLSQSRHLKTRFVPSAVSKTVAPQSLSHYLSQRRRWGSNSYFNNFYYCFGEKMILITRIAALMELLRMSMVYYRVFNTILFLKGLAESFVFIDVLPLLIVSQTPTAWFLFTMLALNHDLRIRSHKLLLGLVVNKIFGPIMSIIVFTKVATNLGSQGKQTSSGTCSLRHKKNTQLANQCAVWGMSGITATTTTITPSELEAQPKPATDTEKSVYT
jgi:cellulose synthase/poly-beta-1,6-N-acetylglucosamine synthase-like glycosyltransferase